MIMIINNNSLRIRLSEGLVSMIDIINLSTLKARPSKFDP